MMRACFGETVSRLTKQGRITLPMDQKPAFRLYALELLRIGERRYALIGMLALRPIIKHWRTKREIRQKKRRPIRLGSGA